MNNTMETQSNISEVLDTAYQDFTALAKEAIDTDNPTTALKAYATGCKFKQIGDNAYEMALDLCKRFGAKWSKSDIATAFGVKPAAASVYVAIRDHINEVEDDGTPLTDIASAVWAVHNQTGTGVVALSNAVSTKRALAKDGKIRAKTVVTESARLVKEAKAALRPEPEPKTLDEKVDAVIRRLTKATTDLDAFTGAGYKLSDEQKAIIHAAKARLA